MIYRLLIFHADDASARGLGVVAMRRQIARKAYERREIANAKGQMELYLNWLDENECEPN
jgi:hypothetical protein